MSFIEGENRSQASLLPPCIDDYIAPAALVRVVDMFVDSLDLGELGFERAVSAATGRPGFHRGDMLRSTSGAISIRSAPLVCGNAPARVTLKRYG